MATVKRTLSAGDQFTLTAPEGYGTGIGSLPKGTEVSVTATHTEPVPGVGGSEGVLFSWIPEGAETPRSAHLPRAEFTRLFKKAGK